MINKIFAALAGLAIAMPASATSWSDVNTLVELVKGTGTTVEAIPCDREGVMGFYQFSQTHSIDRMVICTNAVDMQDSDAVWEVVAHEATHTMQACFGGPILKDTYVPRILRELQETAPHYYQTLMQSYQGSHKRIEMEAFWMELRTPEDVFHFFNKYCYNNPDA